MDSKTEKIIRLNEKIDDMAMQTTQAYKFGTKQELSYRFTIDMSHQK